STEKKSVPQTLVERQKSFPTDPIEIIKYAQQLQKTSAYRLSLNQTRKVTGQDEQTMQQVQDSDGQSQRSDFLKDGLLFTSLLNNSEGLWQCDYLTPQESENPSCYRFSDAASSSAMVADFAQLLGWQKQGLVTFETKKDQRKIDGKERPCQYVRYDLKAGAITPEFVQPIISQNNLTVSAEELKSFTEEFSKFSLMKEQCFDYAVGVPLYTHSVTSLGESSVEDTSSAVSLLTGDQSLGQVSLSLIVKSQEDRDNYFKILLPDGDRFLAVTSNDKLVLIKDGKITTFDEIYQPFAIAWEKNTAIVGTLLKGILKYENGKWIAMPGGEDVGTVKAFIRYQGTLHAFASGGIFKLAGDKWEQLIKLTTKEGSPYEALLDNDTVYYLTSFNGLYAYKNGDLKNVLSKDQVPYGTKFFTTNNKIYLDANGSLYRFLGNDLKIITTLKDYGEFLTATEYQGKFYISTTRGIYTEESDSVKLMADTKKLVDINDFAVFRDELYAGGETGVYVLRDNAWQPVGDPNQFTEVFDLYVYNDSLYAGDMLYLARWDGARWDLIKRDNVKEFFELNGELFAKTESATAIERLDLGKNKTLFDLPAKAERKIIN
ncbi:hypothetical protein HY345_03230, partial [Candidatus Microgenomates bacterium]|nr:hypothetical protein [Candidatus Microgenomates bacterium]